MHDMKSILLAGLIFISSFSYSQQQDRAAQQDTWTLRECVDYALANNLTVKRSEYDVQESEALLLQSKLSRIPTVNAQANYGYSWGRGLDPVTNQFITQEIKSSGVGASASLPIYNGMRINNTIHQSTADYMAYQLDLQKTKNDVIINVASLFITVVFNQELVENARFQLESSQQQLDRTRRQVEVGALPKSDELSLSAQVATNELNLVQQENALSFSILQLKQALQIPANQPFEIEIPEISPEELVLDQNPDEVYDIAKQTMPEVKSAELRVESSYYAVKAARGNLYPRLSLVGNIQTNYSSTSEYRFVSDGGYTQTQRQIGFYNGSPVYAAAPTGDVQYYGLVDQFRDNIYRVLSLQLSIPVFNNYQARTTLQRSRITNERAKISRQETANVLRQNVETAYNDAVAASKTYNSSLKQVQAREEAYRMVQQRYEIGAANYVEYQVAENDLFQARSDLARAKYNFIFKKKILDFYQGKPLDY